MKKDEFIQRTHELIDELSEHIDNLEIKANEIKEDAKVEYAEQIENLKDLRDKLSSKLEEYECIADTKWDIIKESAGNFFEDVAKSWKENFSNVSEAFRKKQTDI
ncbi:MAG: hypothetical protein ACOYEA_06260 [Fermentimonas sp.]|jgi:phage host-nuclease inhibitor protein Gam